MFGPTDTFRCPSEDVKPAQTRLDERQLVDLCCSGEGSDRVIGPCPLSDPYSILRVRQISKCSPDRQWWLSLVHVVPAYLRDTLAADINEIGIDGAQSTANHVRFCEGLRMPALCDAASKRS